MKFRASLLLTLFLATSLCLGDEAQILLSQLLVKGYSASEPLSVEAIERESLQELKGTAPRVPQVPFGFANAEWEALKAKMRPGDVILRVSASPAAWGNMAGWKGLLLVRGDVIVASLTESVN